MCTDKQYLVEEYMRQLAGDNPIPTEVEEQLQASKRLFLTNEFNKRYDQFCREFHYCPGEAAREAFRRNEEANALQNNH